MTASKQEITTETDKDTTTSKQWNLYIIYHTHLKVNQAIEFIRQRSFRNNIISWTLPHYLPLSSFSSPSTFIHISTCKRKVCSLNSEIWVNFKRFA